MNAATKVFHIPELLELILLSLPCDTIYSQIGSSRTILTGRTTSRVWYLLLEGSTPLRRLLYLPSCLDDIGSSIWTQRTPFPPAEPNPWIPQLLLNQRSWGSAWPFETNASAVFEGISPSQPRFWTFALEMSRAQYCRLPSIGPWRELLATSPPFTDFWYTRAFYELGSGRAPFVTHHDYNGKLPKTEQRYRGHRPKGVTLGDLVDAMAELFEKHPTAKFVMVESLRRPAAPETAMTVDERPRTKLYYPGLSAERVHDW